MATKVRVTLVMSLEGDDGNDLSPTATKCAINNTEDAIRHRLMGEGFLPDGINVETYGFDSNEGD